MTPRKVKPVRAVKAWAAYGFHGIMFHTDQPRVPAIYKTKRECLKYHAGLPDNSTAPPPAAKEG